MNDKGNLIEIIERIILGLIDLTNKDRLIWKKEIFNCFSCIFENWKIDFELTQECRGVISTSVAGQSIFNLNNINDGGLCYSIACPLATAIFDQDKRLNINPHTALYGEKNK